jgi:uncharacterized protein
MNVEINTQPFILLHEKALYKPDERLLIIADIHLGKARHFRKEGIPIPARAQDNDYVNLELLFKKIQPEKVYFLGDLFHSSFNGDWDNFCMLVARFSHIEFTLVKGNHDIINARLFEKLNITVTETIEDQFFVYSHEPLQKTAKKKVNITGHIHPGVVISGVARQSIKLPCFYITQYFIILPAFGTLTGLYSMEKTSRAKIYAVIREEVKLIMGQ